MPRTWAYVPDSKPLRCFLNGLGARLELLVYTLAKTRLGGAARPLVCARSDTEPRVPHAYPKRRRFDGSLALEGSSSAASWSSATAAGTRRSGGVAMRSGVAQSRCKRFFCAFVQLSASASSASSDTPPGKTRVRVDTGLNAASQNLATLNFGKRWNQQDCSVLCSCQSRFN